MSSLPLPSLPHASPSSSSPSSSAAALPSDYVYSGVVRRYNGEKAYGFIACPRCPNKRDVFFHQSNVLDEQQLSEQDEIEFTLVRKQAEDGSDRYEALNITVTQYSDPDMEGVKWVNKAAKNNRYRQYDGSALSAPASPAAQFTHSVTRVGRTDSTEEYLSSLPHYGRVRAWAKLPGMQSWCLCRCCQAMKIATSLISALHCPRRGTAAGRCCRHFHAARPSISVAL